jgi:RNA polymerase sigma factor (TIGR02999 family)
VGGNSDRIWDGRGHFYAAAAEAMRCVLVDHARRKQSRKRGGDRSRVMFDAANIAVGDEEEVLAVHEALAGLAAVDPQAAELVKLRYFAGLSNREAALVVNVSVRTANRLWKYAQAWLRHAIGGV